jgi:hypothetical protein
MKVFSLALITCFVVSIDAQETLQYENLLKKYVTGYPNNISQGNTECAKLENCLNPIQKNANFTNSINGCGFKSGDFVPEYDFGQCCNLHDYCFRKCSNLTFETCNSAFENCMNDVCSQKSWFNKIYCKSLQNIYSESVESSVGCKAFQNSVASQCSCH